MTKICTDLKQSRKLVELGLDPNTADMMYLYWINSKTKQEGIEDIPTVREELPIQKGDVPAWSLTALLELMPRIISVKADEHSAYRYQLEWQFANDNSLRYIATNRNECLIDIFSDHDNKYKTEIETAFKMVVWLLKNDYIKPIK